MDANRILCGDALAMLQTLPTDSIHCCVTSPPYYGLRDYGEAGQVGLEETPDEYIARLTDIFREVRRVLVPEGTLWLNIADSYAGSSKGAWSLPPEQRPKTKHRYVYAVDNPAATIPKVWPGVKPKDMIGIPWMLAFSLRGDGWFLRSDIIWHKPNAMPHSAKDRPVNCYEHVFLLSKSQQYYFDYTTLQVPVAESSVQRIRRGFKGAKYSGGAPGQSPQAINQPRPPGNASALRRGRDIWSIGTSNYRSAHFATYPVELVKPCILAGSPAGGVVLDPFFGSGTTGVAALSLGREYVGIEISPANCQLAEARIAEGSG